VLDEIYGHCENYPGLAGILPYIQRHSTKYAAFYIGTRGRSVAQIRNEEKLREAIEGFLDRRAANPKASKDPATIRGEIQKFIFGQPEFAWANERPCWVRWALRLYGPPALGLLGLLAAYILVPVLLGVSWWVLPLVTVVLPLVGVGALFATVLYHEKHDKEDPIKTGDAHVDHVEKLVEREDQVVQNQLSHLVNVKPDRFRLLTLRLVLGAINLLARYVFVRGTLGGIPTIHFARWVIIDGGRRLLFFSNFDESWENYLGDFIDKAAPGLTAIWSNTDGCPKAKGLIGAGARDEQRFKSWTREHQIFTQVWYSAYEELTVDNINNNTAVRMGLYDPLNKAATEAWLARL
jgi:hypothetical protein